MDTERTLSILEKLAAKGSQQIGERLLAIKVKNPKKYKKVVAKLKKKRDKHSDKWHKSGRTKPKAIDKANVITRGLRNAGII